MIGTRRQIVRRVERAHRASLRGLRRLGSQRVERREQQPEGSNEQGDDHRPDEDRTLRGGIVRYVGVETLGPLAASVTRPVFCVLSHADAALRSSAAYAAIITALRYGPYPAT